MPEKMQKEMSETGVVLFQAARVTVNCPPTAVAASSAVWKHIPSAIVPCIRGRGITFRGQSAEDVVHVEYANKHSHLGYKVNQVLEGIGWKAWRGGGCSLKRVNGC